MRRDPNTDVPISRVVSRQAGPPPSAGGPPPGGGLSGATGGGMATTGSGDRLSNVIGAMPPTGGGAQRPNAGGTGGTASNQNPLSISGGPGRSPDGGSSAINVAQQTAQQNVTGAMPFNQTPGMQIASQRISGDQVANDPAISAALADFKSRIAPQIQNRATLSGLGRSTAALNSLTQAQGQMLAPMYESAFAREGDRLNRLGAASENELGRRERSAARVADANQNMIQNLMGLSNTMYGRQQGTAQNLMGAGGQLRDIGQQANQAEMNDFLRRQALGEQAVYAPFGGLAQAGMGSSTTQTGK